MKKEIIMHKMIVEIRRDVYNLKFFEEGKQAIENDMAIDWSGQKSSFGQQEKRFVRLGFS